MRLSKSKLKKIRKQIITILSLLLTLIYFVQRYLLPPEKIEVDLVRCVDGDTARFMVYGEEESVRFLAIDTPESTMQVEAFGKEAAAYTCDLLEGANLIELEFDPLADTDKYDRLLAWIWVDDVLLQSLIVENGYAEVAYLYDDYKYADDLLKLEQIASKKHVGIWK